jgi:hypothetical protein
MLFSKRRSGIVGSIFAIIILTVIAGSALTLSAWGDEPGGGTVTPPQQIPQNVNDSLSTPIHSADAPENPMIVDIIVLIVKTIL